MNRTMKLTVGLLAGAGLMYLFDPASGHLRRSRLTEGRVSDDILVQRVRSELGRLVSHPHAIHVASRDGTIILSGPILTKEKDTLLKQTRSVRGVLNVENRLETHDEPNGISSLQG